MLIGVWGGGLDPDAHTACGLAHGRRHFPVAVRDASTRAEWSTRNPLGMIVERRRRPFVEQFRKFCLTVPAEINSAFSLGNSLEDFLSGSWEGS